MIEAKIEFQEKELPRQFAAAVKNLEPSQK
jgi:hypothetical protein